MRKLKKIILVLMIIISIYSITFNVNAYDIWQTGRNFIGLGVNHTRN